MIEEKDGSPEAPKGTRAHSNPRRIVALIDDLIFRSKVRETAAGLGMEAIFAGSAEAMGVAIETATDLVIVDLGASVFDPIGSIGKAKAKGLTVLAFGSHVDAAALTAARGAGADEVVPRSLFSAQLAGLMTALSARGRQS